MFELLLLPLTLMGWAFLIFPWTALLPAALMLWLYRRCRRVSTLIAALLWSLYTGYELAMYHRILCSGECNIRVDLLLIYPLLLLATLIAGLSYWRWTRRQTRG